MSSADLNSSNEKLTSDKNKNNNHNGNHSVMVLDETTGLLIPLECTPVNEDEEENVDSSLFINMRLDETTGLFVVDSDQSVSSRGLLNSSNSLVLNQTDSATSDVSPSRPAAITLSEHSGIMSKKRSRKHQGDNTDWERNRVKKARVEGKAYFSMTRKKDENNSLTQRRERKIKPGCTSKKCAASQFKKCNEISQQIRKKIFNSFWKDLNWDQKQSYVISLVTKEIIPRKENSKVSRRNFTLQYHLMVNNKRLLVCKQMFLSTLSLGESQVLNWVRKSSDFGVLKKIKIKNTRKESKQIKGKLSHVENFLNQLPKMESHYCRKDTSKLYLDNLYKSVQDVYRDFKNSMQELNIPDTEVSSYGFFAKKMQLMNVDIFQPRKDFCDTCFAYKNKNISTEEYNEHVKEKDRARDEKDQDKIKAIAGQIKAFTVDVQAVQMIPHLPAGALYFKQKLKCHQFTVYNIANGDVLCYVWHEGEGGMDGNIFASCLIDFLQSEITLDTPIVFYSDGCSAQNRNVTITNALYQFSAKNNVEIFQKYLVKGHTQMECDSVHAAIERRKKDRELYAPCNFVQVIQESRLKKPYKVKYLDYKFFKNYSELKFFKSIRPGNKTGSPTVLQLRALKYSNAKLMFKLSFDDEWKDLPQRLNNKHSVDTDVKDLYSKEIPLTTQKYRDLLSLKPLLPKDYHSFYDNLTYVKEK